MDSGVYKIPAEFKDEDKWVFGLFTKKQLIWMLIGVVLDLIVIRFLFAVHAYAMAVAIAVYILVVMALICKLSMPEKFFLMGGGNTLSTLLIRKCIKLISSERHVLYIKNYDSSLNLYMKQDMKNGDKKITKQKENRK